ncbi:hypothetical protein D8I35_09515 [Corticibacter populi]|uniref:Uncharacterized protein n=1 Tax=Corticibacter populi TaxID=1550736 RepID=A0A3M6QVX2_9BURK|nr:hypothetical protein [Corticibacter populi]RMX06729.1 hypothetical protein D8I35_09515 [Corticibacter populi]RZS31690.1 hypothetical protein EV687_2359 [Corticibacter populi]
MSPVSITRSSASASSQLTLNFEPSLPERFPSLREFLAYRTQVGGKPMKVVAADMDLSPSMLTRKLNPGDGDTQRLNVDDFEGWLRATGDASAVVEYLAAKYLDDDTTRQARVVGQVERLLCDLSSLLPQLKHGGEGTR